MLIGKVSAETNFTTQKLNSIHCHIIVPHQMHRHYTTRVKPSAILPKCPDVKGLILSDNLPEEKVSDHSIPLGSLSFIVSVSYATVCSKNFCHTVCHYNVQVRTFMVMYHAHCQRIYDAISRANFNEVNVVTNT